MSKDTNPDILGMSDEEFAKLSDPTDVVVEDPKPQPPVVPAPVVTKDEADDETQDNTQTGADDDTAVEGQSGADDDKGNDEDDETPAGDPPATGTAVPAGDLPGDPAKPVTKAEGEGDDDKDEGDPAPKLNTGSTDYEAFYKQVMAPFKANGKTMQLQSADEVISLMQMGANFTKKMQAIQEHKKFLMMLEQNGLLDVNKLSFYIDLEKKNPEAIKKFLKDSNIDPVDFDTSSEVNYKGGTHAVSDQEATFHSAIEDLKSQSGGAETLQSINAWDQASKKQLWDNPELLSVIHAQRENGVYTRVSAEIDRRKVLGQIAPNVGFLQAYKIVGDDLVSRGVIQGVTQPAPSGQQPVQVRTPVTVRPAKTPGTKAADASKVRAAAATRSVSRPAKTAINVLAMSDDEFLKFEGKV